MPKKGSFIYQRTSGQWGEGYSPTYKAESHTRHDQAYGRASREAPDKFHVHLTVSPSPPELPRTPGFQETALEWLEQKRLRVEPATFVKYHNLLHRHLLPAFGNRSLASLNRTDVLNFTQMLLDSGRLDRRGGLSEKTVKDILLVLRSILEYGRCGENAPPAIQITYPREQAKDMRTLTDSERLLLETYLTTDTDVQKLGVLLCLYTGLRIGEVCALRWSDISLTEKSLRVERTASATAAISGAGWRGQRKNAAAGGHAQRAAIPGGKSPCPNGLSAVSALFTRRIQTAFCFPGIPPDARIPAPIKTASKSSCGKQDCPTFRFIRCGTPSPPSA